MKHLLTVLLVFAFISSLKTPIFAVTPNFNQKPDPSVKQNTPSGMIRSCEARLSAVKKRMTQLVRLSKSMEEKFDTITHRTENYYLNKVVPTGKTLDNYSQLRSDINAKMSVVTIAISDAQKDIDNFNCSSDNPKDLYSNFVKNMQKVKSALKEYRTSIKNFIQAIRQLVPEDVEPKITPTS